MRRSLILGTLALALILILLALNTARNAMGWQPLTDTPARREALLAPSWRLLLPPGRGPHRAAVLLSGCDGVYDNMDYWAQLLTRQGYAALIVDSHAPRGLDRAPAWLAMCAGQVLPGAERAGDLAVALAALHRMPGIDPQGTLILGASHGGWTIMELMARLKDGAAPPPGLTEWPAPPQELAGQIGPVVLLYPYCGLISGGDDAPWPAGAQGLMILAQHDRITDAGRCRDMAEKLRRQGTRIRAVTLPGVDHGFDQRERSALSPLEFDQRARDRATMLVQDFLQGFASPPRPGL